MRAEPGVVAVARLRAAIRLLYPSEMTPAAKRMLESICDDGIERGFGAKVTDAGGGVVTLLVDRNTWEYPDVGQHVEVAT
jgi:hypothetical protein